MAESTAHLSQAPVLPPLSTEHEEVSDVIPLMGLTRDLNVRAPTDDHLYSPDIRPDAGDRRRNSFATSPNHTSVFAALSAGPSALLRPAASVVARPFNSLSKAVESRVRNSRFHGWRMGVMLGCSMSFVVLCCNIAIIAVGAARGSSSDAKGIWTIYQGNDVSIWRLNTALHVLINALSTVLLSASNYTMQVLSSPTRAEVDTAHARGSWLDIGILSPRNLRGIAKKRAVLWLILAASSVPLHLFYNASVFRVTTTSVNFDYGITLMKWNTTSWNDTKHATDNDTWSQGRFWDMTEQWEDFYRTQSLVSHGNLFLAIDRIAYNIQNIPNPDNVTLATLSMNLTDYLGDGIQTSLPVEKVVTESTGWISGREIFLNGTLKVLLTDSLLHVKEASSEKRNVIQDRVQISLYFMLVVVCFNTLKLVTLLYVLVTDRSAYLVTLGDAASSFLEHNDPHTKEKCVFGRDEMLLSIGHPLGHHDYTDREIERSYQHLRGIWRPHRQPYVQGARFVLLLLFVFLMIMSSTWNAWTPGVTWRWGAASNSYLYRLTSTSAVATLWSAWLANLPQLLVSFCYFSVNLVCTSMAGTEEWNHFATSRKGLRVTKPSAKQRSTYFLQLPYRWSLPLTAIGGALHWLVSQAFFLVRVDDVDGGESTSACGVSLLSLITLLCVFWLLLFTICAVGHRMMPIKAPLIASCSLAISAACHPPPDDVDAHLGKVQWGVTDNEVVTGFRHCSLSSKPVTEPEEGRTYY